MTYLPRRAARPAAIAAAILAFGLPLGLAGCDSGEDAQAPAQEGAATGDAVPAGGGTLTVVSWGGAYTKSQEVAFHKPYTEETGVEIQSVDYEGNVAPIKAQDIAGDVSWDVVDVELADAIRLCDEGLLAEIDASTLPDAPDGTAAADDFIEGTLYPCAVGNIIWSKIIAYDTTAFPDNPPTTVADFFDTENFPGKRGLRKTPKSNLEMALMADGVPPEEVYDVLASPEGRDRAFAMLDKIKDDVVWWEAGAQPPQLLADGEVVMTGAYNGRIFNAAVDEGQPFEIIWDHQIWVLDLWVVPAGSPDKELAMDFIRFASRTDRMAEQTRWIAYGPARKSADALVTTHATHGVEMRPNLPTYPPHLENALQSDETFWADYQVELEQRFNAWLAS